MFESYKASRKLSMLSTRILNRPLMMTEGSAAVVLDALAGRLGIAQIGAFDEYGEEPKAAREAQYEVVSGVAIIPIVGELVQRSGYLGAMSGVCSYSDIVETARAAAEDENVHAGFLDLDSPGGEVSGLFDAADDIARAFVQAGKPLWAYSNERAFSAAYALAAVADRIIVSRTSGVGSIGVVAAHCDQSKKDEKDGVKVTFVTAGEYKVDGNSHEPLKDRAKARLQAEVDRIYGLFTDHVARYRGMAESDVRATEAGCFYGNQAVAEGLADALMPFEDALVELVSHIQSKRKADAAEAASAEKGSNMGSVNRAEALKRKLMAFGGMLTRGDVSEGVTRDAKTAALIEADKQAALLASAKAEETGEEADEDKKPEDGEIEPEAAVEEADEGKSGDETSEDDKDPAEATTAEEGDPDNEEIDEAREAARNRASAGGSTGSKPGLAANHDPKEIVKVCEAAGLPALANSLILKGSSVADAQRAVRAHESCSKIVAAAAALDPSLKTKAVSDELLASAAGDENAVRQLILDRVTKAASEGSKIESLSTPGSTAEADRGSQSFDAQAFAAERQKRKDEALAARQGNGNKRSRRG